MDTLVKIGVEREQIVGYDYGRQNIVDFLKSLGYF